MLTLVLHTIVSDGRELCPHNQDNNIVKNKIKDKEREPPQRSRKRSGGGGGEGCTGKTLMNRKV